MREDWKLKYRPKTYDEVVGQDSAVKILQGEVYSAYILAGKTGSGKTTLARIFANQLGAEVQELDASSLGKDDILTLRESAYYKPLFGDYKVIIIDECHALSNAAWQSLLKVIEESPKHTVWLLLTTEPHKIIQTIENRARRVDIFPVGKKDMYQALNRILQEEGITDVPEMVINDIISSANGSVRLAIEYLQTYHKTGIYSVPSGQMHWLELLTKIYDVDLKDRFDEIIEDTENITASDLEAIVKAITGSMNFLAMIPYLGPEKADQAIFDYTDFEVDKGKELLRDLKNGIYSKLPSTEGNAMLSIVQELADLMHEIISVYNVFLDNKNAVQGVLVSRHLKHITPLSDLPNG